MTAIEFNKLKENERAAIVWEQGVLIEEKIVDKSQIKIYSMKDFFVEVWTDIKKLNLQKVQALEKESNWSAYLNNL
jgi:hypothetical protein